MCIRDSYTVEGPTTPEDYVRLMRDIMLRDVRDCVAPEDERWQEIGQSCVDASLSGRNCEAISNNIRAHVQDFDYPDEYFRASFERRQAIVAERSQKVSIDDVLKRINDYIEFQREADDRAETDRFEREVEQMVRQLNAGREAAERAAEALAAAKAAQG